eukprot:CAMPEP_0203745666 /NCGR_PEP_ID=MMETSP0098-20131031/1332_1 /ASSEMBLY_ACC=CAM_ASM_000208 /TAXON_ID=96639 /ORGANISM=" , Strain NY0313808BC1" /LENGTH=547 /DNA_ID=CAMNT_0050633511 /DNA_START=2143 /DNA_END=3783 /DNA_ORIENTATION=+
MEGVGSGFLIPAPNGRGDDAHLAVVDDGSGFTGVGSRGRNVNNEVVVSDGRRTGVGGTPAENDLRKVADTLSRTGKILSAGLAQANEQGQRLRGSIARLERSREWSLAERKRAEDEVSAYFNMLHEVLKAKEEELLRDTKGVYEVQEEDNNRRLGELVTQGQKLSKACTAIQELHEGTSNATIGSLNAPLNSLLEALESSSLVLDREEELVASEASRISQNSGGRPSSADPSTSVNNDDRGVKFYFCHDQSIQRTVESIEMVQYESFPPVVLVGTPAAVADESQRRRLGASTGVKSIEGPAIGKDAYPARTRTPPTNTSRSFTSPLGGDYAPTPPRARDMRGSNLIPSPDKSDPQFAGEKQYKVKAVVPYEDDTENRGVIHYLGSKENTNAFSNPALFSPDSPCLVVLRASSRIEGDLASLAGFKHYDGSFFETDSALSSWVSVEFPSPIAPSHYTLGYYVNGEDHVPRNWVLQGSQDNTTWATLKVHENDVALDGDMHLATWKIPKQANTKGPFRFFRIMQTGPTSTGTMFLVLSFIEFFGTIFNA